MEKQKLLEVKKAMKKRKPTFIRNDANKKKRLEAKWHRPKGLTNKMRLNKRGYPRVVSTGYRTPVELRGLTKHGLEPVTINKISDLLSLDPTTQIALVSSTMGQRKKVAVLEKAKEMKLKIQNIKNIEDYLTFVKEEMQTRKENKEVVAKKKEERVKEAEKKAKAKEAEEKKKQEEEKTLSVEEKAEKEEEIQKKEKEEKEKVLTKRQ